MEVQISPKQHHTPTDYENCNRLNVIFKFKCAIIERKTATKKKKELISMESARYNGKGVPLFISNARSNYFPMGVAWW